MCSESKRGMPSPTQVLAYRDVYSDIIVYILKEPILVDKYIK